MKKVYIVLHTLSTGGAERHASSVANYLAEHGYKVSIFLLDDENVMYRLSEGIDVVSISNSSSCQDAPSFLQKILLKLNKTFCKKNYYYLEKLLYFKLHYVNKLISYLSAKDDIENSTVISFMPIPNICAAMAKQKVKYNLILGEFNSPHLEFTSDAPENIMKKKYFPNADGFVFQTEEQQSFYTFLPNVKKKIIPNPIEDIRTKPYIGIRRKEIVNFCRLVKVKNIPLLVEAFAKLHTEYQEYSLVIYGEGSDENRIKKCIEKHNISDSVTIKPFAQNVLDLVRDSAMFVSSSDREGISNSMLEAMAIGLPTISTDCPAGGARMMIKPYENGLLVPVKDPEAMYRAMKYMIEHPDGAEQMGRNAVAIRERLEKNKILEQWLSFIDRFYEESNQ